MAATRLAPSGRQVELVHGHQRVVVVEVGGGLRSYSVGGRDLLDGYGDDEVCPSGRGQLLLPWPNRIEDGWYEWDGRQHQLPLTEVGSRNAIHGLTRWAAWTVSAAESGRAVLQHVLHPQPGYPFALALEVEYRLSAAGLLVRTTATNVGAQACPYGAGAHPYLTVGTPTVDAVVLRAPGGTVLDSDARGIPRDAVSVTGTELDFRQSRPIGAVMLDNAFTDLEREPDGTARVELRRPDDATGLTLWVDESFGYLMLFTGDPLPDVARRSLAVEPMTCPPNAFRSGKALIRLEPGESHTGTWGIAPAPGPLPA